MGAGGCVNVSGCVRVCVCVYVFWRAPTDTDLGGQDLFVQSEAVKMASPILDESQVCVCVCVCVGSVCSMYICLRMRMRACVRLDGRVGLSA